MRIEQLEAFVEVASSKSISIAAENLYITQPSLSRSMKLLEDELGLTLFIRSSDGVRLTDSGKSASACCTKYPISVRQSETTSAGFDRSTKTPHTEPTQNLYITFCSRQYFGICF